MLKRAALLVIILILTLPASVLAAEPGNGLIEGQLVNGTNGGSSVADQEIILKAFVNDAEVNSSTTASDAEGRFTFAGLSTEADYEYQVWLTYQEAEYDSEMISFNGDETTKSTEITVYDSTSDDVLNVVATHIFIYPGEGRLDVEEYYLFTNDTDHAYVGGADAATTGRLRFYLPSGVTDMQPAMGLMECCLVLNEDGFGETMAVLPGDKEVAYSYVINGTAGEYTFSHRLNYPIAKLNLLIQGEGIGASSDQLITEEPLDIEGVKYTYLTGENFIADSTLEVQLAGLPIGNQGAIVWVIVALVLMIAGTILVYQMRKNKLQPKPQPVRTKGNPARRKQGLLVELARLDDDFEDGKIPEETYRRLRAQKKTELSKLIQR
ncbi:hypothetical protein ACFLYX_01685 [Chloroflexota bacterium]